MDTLIKFYKTIIIIVGISVILVGVKENNQTNSASIINNYADKREHSVGVLPSAVEENKSLPVFIDKEPNPHNNPAITKQEFVYPYPEYITVRITGVKECKNVNGSYKEVVRVPFKDYVKGVLANEWGHSWHEESIRAGAIAVKMYALNAINTGGKWGGEEYGIVYDCDWDMVYNPNITRESTNKAVDDTWDYILVDANEEPVKKIHFLAWWGACINWLGDEGNCIGQWNSKKDAENGMTFDEILPKYFYGTQVINLRGE